MFNANKVKYSKQAGAELCQAQEKLGLAKPELLSKNGGSFQLTKYIEVIFH
jgi:hypothetical protein